MSSVYLLMARSSEDDGLGCVTIPATFIPAWSVKTAWPKAQTVKFFSLQQTHLVKRRSKQRIKLKASELLYGRS